MIEINTQEQGLQVLINVAKVAVKRGAFELEEVESILKAIKLFTVPAEQKVEKATQDVVNKVKSKV